MSDLPPLRSKGGGRTRPARRRPQRITLSTRDLMRQQSLSKVFFVIASLVALISLVTAGLRQTDRVTSTESTAGGTQPAESRLLPGAVLVDVVKIVDGDTLDVRASETDLRVRLYGVDTPERGDHCFKEATERTRALAGSRVQLVPDARLQDSFKRELRYVYTVSGESIDAALVREGLALAWREDGSQRTVLIALEDQARAAKAGCLWSGS